MIYINQGNADRNAKNYTEALALFDRAAALGDPKVELAAYEGADIALIQETPPDTARIKAYADKALAIDANDAYANFFEGYYYAEEYGKSHNANSKAQALTYLDKADTLAKAAGIQFLATQAEKLKTQLTAQAPPGSE
jgi:tetratricopeptide (TPR) repeat protein